MGIRKCILYKLSLEEKRLLILTHLCVPQIPSLHYYRCHSSLHTWLLIKVFGKSRTWWAGAAAPGPQASVCLGKPLIMSGLEPQREDLTLPAGPHSTFNNKAKEEPPNSTVSQWPLPSGRKCNLVTASCLSNSPQGFQLKYRFQKQNWTIAQLQL